MHNEFFIFLGRTNALGPLDYCNNYFIDSPVTINEEYGEGNYSKYIYDACVCIYRLIIETSLKYYLFWVSLLAYAGTTSTYYTKFEILTVD